MDVHDNIMVSRAS